MKSSEVANPGSSCSEPDTRKVRILSIEVNVLTRQEVLNLLDLYIISQTPHYVITANSLMVKRVTGDASLREAFSTASLVIPDSAGIVWAARFLKGERLERLPGIDLMVQVCRLASSRSYRVYVFGSQERVNRMAVENLKRRFSGLNVVGRHHGYFEPEEEEKIVADIKGKRPDILFVGLDVPRQEKWMMKNHLSLGVPLMMGIGGSMDIISGRLRRAPVWMRLLGLEWFYRFAQQPWRIGRIMSLPVFVLKVVRQKVEGWRLKVG